MTFSHIYIYESFVLSMGMETSFMLLECDASFMFLVQNAVRL